MESDALDTKILKILGIINANPITEDEKELCDIEFARYRGLYDIDDIKDETYINWFLKIPVEKKLLIENLFPIDYIPIILDRNNITNNRVLSMLNDTSYENSESSTDYSDEDSFRDHYGYWADDSGVSESDSDMDTSDVSASDVSASDVSASDMFASTLSISDVPASDVEMKL